MDDSVKEDTETLTVNLISSTGKFILQSGTATGTILDNDKLDSIPGDTSTTATIDVGESREGNIDTLGDVDWYKTSLTKDHCYRIDVQGKDHDSSLTLRQPVISGLYRDDGSYIEGTSPGRRLHVKLDATRTYYISVGVFRFYESGNYRLKLEDLGTSSSKCDAAKAGVIRLSVGDDSAGEWPNPLSVLEFKVSLGVRSEEDVRVDYTTVDGTATAGEDYEAQSGTLVIPAGEWSRTVRVVVKFDRDDESSETLTLVLSNPQGAEIADGTATGTIRDYSTRGG